MDGEQKYVIAFISLICIHEQFNPGFSFALNSKAEAGDFTQDAYR